MKISFRFVIPCLKRLTFQRHGIYKDFYRFTTRLAEVPAKRVRSGMTLTLVGIFLSGCIHQDQQAWSDQRENGNTPLVLPSLAPTPSATPTPTLPEFVERKMIELDEIDEELLTIDRIFQLPVPP